MLQLKEFSVLLREAEHVTSTYTITPMMLINTNKLNNYRSKYVIVDRFLSFKEKYFFNYKLTNKSNVNVKFKTQLPPAQRHAAAAGR